MNKKYVTFIYIFIPFQKRKLISNRFIRHTLFCHITLTKVGPTCSLSDPSKNFLWLRDGGEVKLVLETYNRVRSHKNSSRGELKLDVVPNTWKPKDLFVCSFLTFCQYRPYTSYVTLVSSLLKNNVPSSSFKYLLHLRTPLRVSYILSNGLYIHPFY